jgi:hypothetical protein
MVRRRPAAVIGATTRYGEAGMTKVKGVVSHREHEVAELRADRELVVEYLKAATAELDKPRIAEHACWPCGLSRKPMARVVEPRA